MLRRLGHGPYDYTTGDSALHDCHSALLIYYKKLTKKLISIGIELAPSHKQARSTTCTEHWIL